MTDLWTLGKEGNCRAVISIHQALSEGGRIELICNK